MQPAVVRVSRYSAQARPSRSMCLSLRRYSDSKCALHCKNTNMDQMCFTFRHKPESGTDKDAVDVVAWLTDKQERSAVVGGVENDHTCSCSLLQEQGRD